MQEDGSHGFQSVGVHWAQANPNWLAFWVIHPTALWPGNSEPGLNIDNVAVPLQLCAAHSANGMDG